MFKIQTKEMENGNIFLEVGNADSDNFFLESEYMDTLSDSQNMENVVNFRQIQFRYTSKKWNAQAGYLKKDPYVTVVFYHQV